MNYRIVLNLICCLVMFTACSIESGSGLDVPNTGDNSKIVSFNAAQSNGESTSYAQTKTGIDKDYKTTKWDKDDKIYIWATKKGESNFVINNNEFSVNYYGSSFNNAVFRGFIPDKLEDAEYSYYGVYPKPKSINGNIASYNIGTQQSGNYNGLNDIMVAEPTNGALLTIDPSEEFNLIFKHLMHLIRIEIPSDRNLMGDEFHKLKIEFPQNVVGDYNVNFINKSCQYIENSNSSNVITVNRPTIGDGNYIWLFIPPTAISNKQITFIGYNSSGRRSYSISTTLNKSLEAGKVTPIKLTIPETRPPYTKLVLNITKNNLGEAYKTITIKAPSGALFYENQANTVTFNKNSSERYEISYLQDSYGEAFKRDGIEVVYDSENAEVKETISLANVIGYDDNIFDKEVPYLYTEDFSGVATFENGADPGWSSPKQIPISLDKYKLPGWTADRAGGSSSAKSIRTMCRLEGGMGAQKQYKGRLDSPALTNIKSGKKIKMKVTYRYSGSENEYTGSKDGTPKYNHGYTDIAGVINAGDHTIEHQIGGDMEQGTSGSYDKVSNYGEYTSEKNVSKTTRLSWYAKVSRGKEFAQGGNYWLYIDDIKVQIAN